MSPGSTASIAGCENTDPDDGFTQGSSTNGNWAYGSLNSDGTGFSLFAVTAALPAGVQGRAETSANTSAGIGRCSLASDCSDGKIVVPVDTFALRPGNTKLSALRFTAPATDSYAFDFDFSAAQIQSGNATAVSADIKVFVDGTEVGSDMTGLRGTIDGYIGSFGGLNYDSGYMVVSLAAGETVSFAIASRGSTSTVDNVILDMFGSCPVSCADVDNDGICDTNDTEECDGVDNDGDTQIDEGGVCAECNLGGSDAAADFVYSPLAVSGPWQYGSALSGGAGYAMFSSRFDNTVDKLHGWRASASDADPKITDCYGTADCLTSGTVFPMDALVLKPGTTRESILRFTAEEASVYSFDAEWMSARKSPLNPASANVEVRLNGALVTGTNGTIDGFYDVASAGNQKIEALEFELQEGDVVDFVANSRGSTASRDFVSLSIVGYCVPPCADSDGDGTCDIDDTEECDGVDNDGDTQIDEGGVCGVCNLEDSDAAADFVYSTTPVSGPWQYGSALSGGSGYAMFPSRFDNTVDKLRGWRTSSSDTDPKITDCYGTADCLTSGTVFPMAALVHKPGTTRESILRFTADEVSIYSFDYAWMSARKSPTDPVSANVEVRLNGALVTGTNGTIDGFRDVANAGANQKIGSVDLDLAPGDVVDFVANSRGNTSNRDFVTLTVVGTCDGGTI